MYFLSFNKKNSRPVKDLFKGFTILELMVTLTIGTIILATVITGQSKYTDSASLKALVNDVSLTIRQSQVYGLSVKENSTGSNNFKTSYGINFNTSFNDKYVYFGDSGSTLNGIYDGSYPGCAQECIQMNTIPRGNLLVNPMCRIALNGVETCDIGRADIVFTRPSPEAQITIFNNSNGAQLSMSGYKGIRIKFVSPKGATRSIVIYTTGQISVQ